MLFDRAGGNKKHHLSIRQLHASWTDGLGDVSEPQIDLYMGTVFAETGADNVAFAIHVAGMHSDSTASDETYEIALNTDGDPSTGTTVGSFVGVDKVVRISLHGAFPFSGTAGSESVHLIDTTSGTETEIAPGAVKRLLALSDSLDPSAGEGTPVSDVITQAVPLSALGLSTSSVSVGITATDHTTGGADTVRFIARGS